eukprot:GHRR01007653.1.p2 GENE.GHRR01007653.1~~GHRR01007653.1.p2  ORF type:complete len:151 (-),score=32.37 GHRR01007653.1:2873-3325(-)
MSRFRIALSAANAAVPSQQLFAAVAARRISTRGVVAMGHGSHHSDNNPEILEQEKQRNLTGQTPEIVPGQPGWNPALASDSEAAVRAEHSPSLPFEELQAHTIKVVQHLHRDDKSDMPIPDEVHDPSQAPAIRDNLQYSQGTLKDADNPV